MLKTGRILTQIADLAMPRRCAVCGARLLPDERSVCVCCLGDLPETHFENCSRNPMADRLNSKLEEGPYLYATALYHYRGGYASISQSLKYHRNFATGKLFGRMLGDRLSGSTVFGKGSAVPVDLVIPVPLHWTRKWSRGYNQAGIIAAEVADRLGCPVDTGILRRCRRTSSQLHAAEREKNVRGAFAARTFKTGNHPCTEHILLVDDVFTSGSTAASCIEALRGTFGPELRISVATLGYAGD